LFCRKENQEKKKSS